MLSLSLSKALSLVSINNSNDISNMSEKINTRDLKLTLNIIGIQYVKMQNIWQCEIFCIWLFVISRWIYLLNICFHMLCFVCLYLCIYLYTKNTNQRSSQMVVPESIQYKVPKCWVIISYNYLSLFVFTCHWVELISIWIISYSSWTCFEKDVWQGHLPCGPPGKCSCPTHCPTPKYVKCCWG